MTNQATALKAKTISRYEYLVEDGFDQYKKLLQEAQSQPDSYWETRTNNHAKV